MAVAEAELPQPSESPAVRNLDGYAYPFTDSKKGSYLIVMPPQGDGLPVDAEMVERELRKLSIEGVDWDRVRAAIAAQSGQPSWILTGVDPDEESRKAAEAAAAEAAKPKPVDKSQFCFITISEDYAAAKLTLVPPEDRAVELSMEDVQKALADNGVVYGISEEHLAEVEEVLDRIRDGDWTEPFETEIAHGIDAEHGVDAQYEFYADPGGERESKPRMSGEGGDGRVDYFAVKEIENVKRGTAIARRIPPTRGVPGKSVKGEEIPARDGTDGGITVGSGVEHALGNENILVAAIDGQVKFENGTLSVQALYEVPGDVDISTGHIDFIGTVVVKGNVQPGLKITAGEDVAVEGVVDDAEIHAKGKVTVKGGVLGQGGKAKISAGGDVTAKYIRNATIDTKGMLRADEGVLYSKVSAFAVKVSGKRGQIVGGEITAETEIVATTIGSNSSASPTVLTAGDNPARRQELHGLTEQVKKMEEAHDKAKKALAVLDQMKARTGMLPPDKRDVHIKATRERFKLENEIRPLQERIAHLITEEEEQRKHHQARISVMGTMYPGVKVQIRNAKRHIVEELRYCSLTEKGSEIKQGPFK